MLLHKLATFVTADENVGVKITPFPDPQQQLVCIGEEVTLDCHTVPEEYVPVVYKWKFVADGQHNYIEARAIKAVVRQIPVTYTCVASHPEIADGMIGRANLSLQASG